MSTFNELDGAMWLGLDPLADDGCVRDGCWELTAETLRQDVAVVRDFCEENCGWVMEARRLLPSTPTRCAQAIVRLSLTSHDAERRLGAAWIAAEVDASIDTRRCADPESGQACALRRIPLEATDPRVISDPGWPDLDGDGLGERLVIHRPTAPSGECSVPEDGGPAWLPPALTVTVEGTRGELLAGPIVVDGPVGFENPAPRGAESDRPLRPCAALVPGPWIRREAVGGALLRSLAPMPGFEVVFAAMRSTCNGPCGVGGSAECVCDAEATYMESHQFAHGAAQDVSQRRVDDDAGVLRVRADCDQRCRVVAVPSTIEDESVEAFAPGPGPNRAAWRTFDSARIELSQESRDGHSGVRLPPGRHVVWVFDGDRSPIAFEVFAPQDHEDLTLDTRGER